MRRPPPSFGPVNVKANNLGHCTLTYGGFEDRLKLKDILDSLGPVIRPSYLRRHWRAYDRQGPSIVQLNPNKIPIAWKA